MKKVIGALIILYIIAIIIFHLNYSYTMYWIDEEIIIGYTIIAFLILLCCVRIFYTRWFQKIIKGTICSKIKFRLNAVKQIHILLMIPIIIIYIFSISFAKTLGYKDGYDVGHEEGYKKGYEVGYEEGKKQGYKEGKEDGRQTGYRQGYSAGQTNTRTCPMCLGRGVQAHFSCNGQGCSLCGNTGVEKCIHCNGRGFTYY